MSVQRLKVGLMTSEAPSLSPSRAAEFVMCPLRYRFRAIDRLPEPPSAEAVRGTLVHLVLERLFDLPAAERTPAAAVQLLAPAWQDLVALEPECLDLHADDEERDRWLETAAAIVERYFVLEDPRSIEPAERELFLEHLHESGVVLRGIIDRVDAAPDGALRIVDYKTGRPPGERYEAAALFQLRFYALLLWRTRGVLPTVLQLLYVADGTVLSIAPDADDLRRTEQRAIAVWRAIRSAEASGEWLPGERPPCSWCAYQALCPAWGGTPPPLPATPTPRAADVLS